MINSGKISEIVTGILKNDRKTLAQAITLIESTRVDDRKNADKLLSKLLPHTGNSIRIGISGVPGVGKSTFIESFGLRLIESGHRVAVLAIDPSSPKTGGSILGDKTRMEKLSKHKDSFIRPSPTQGKVGGVSRRTRETILLAEASGFDIILIETVGVGQSETTVAMLTDIFLLLISPAGGDDLQGIKKGIVELSDLIIVNKADGDLLQAANRTAVDYANALQFLRNEKDTWQPLVLKCSALKDRGIPSILKAVNNFCKQTQRSGLFQTRRSEQAVAAMWEEISERLNENLRSNNKVKKIINNIQVDLRKGMISPSIAANQILKSFLN